MGPSFPSCQQLLCDLEQVTWGLGTVLLAESCEGAGGHLDKAGSAHTARPWPGSSKHTADSGWANKALSLLPSRTHGQGGWGLAVLRLQGQVIHSPGVYLLGSGDTAAAAAIAAAVDTNKQQKEQHGAKEDEEDDEGSGVPLGLEQRMAPQFSQHFLGCGLQLLPQVFRQIHLSSRPLDATPQPRSSPSQAGPRS